MAFTFWFFLKNVPFPAYFYFYFSSFQYTVDSKQMFNIKTFLPMTGFDPWTSGIVSDRSTNWATTTALRFDSLLKSFYFVFLSYISTNSSFQRSRYLGYNQCDQIWHNCALLGNILEVFDYILRVYLIFEKISNQLWHIFMLLGKISLLQMAKCWSNNLVTLDFFT